MMKKVYVKEEVAKNYDGENLQVVQAYPDNQKPNNFKYLLFLSK